MARKAASREPNPVRFKGGGLHGETAPSTIVDIKSTYYAYRTYEQDKLVAGAPCCDVYRWEPGSGWMAYVGTVFGLDGLSVMRKDKTLPKMKPPVQWAREFAMAREGR